MKCVRDMEGLVPILFIGTGAKRSPEKPGPERLQLKTQRAVGFL